VSVEDSSKRTKVFIAFFFVFHYGFFHFVYVFFINSLVGGIDKVFHAAFFLCIIAFIVEQVFYTWHHARDDQKQKVEIAKLLISPYYRIIPMHIFLIAGAMLTILWDKQIIVLIFLILKMLSDLILLKKGISN